jgi:hypothetical protein
MADRESADRESGTTGAGGTTLYEDCTCGHVRGGHGRPGDAAVAGRSSTACTVCPCPRFRADRWWRRALQRVRPGRG